MIFLLRQWIRTMMDMRVKIAGIKIYQKKISHFLSALKIRLIAFCLYGRNYCTSNKAWETSVIAAHGNSLRALIKYLDNVSDEDILSMNVPTGMPLVYELDENLKPLSRQYLGDPEKVAKAMEAVANQGKAK